MVRLPKVKINVIRRYYLLGQLKGARIARELHIQRDTVTAYFKEFREIEERFPGKIRDFSFLLPRPKPFKLPAYAQLIAALPELVDGAETGTLEILSLWKRYRLLYPQGYGLYYFSIHFNDWKRANRVCKYHHRRIRALPPEDETILRNWRRGKNVRLWQKAVVILDSLQAIPVRETSEKVEVSEETILGWISRYRERGLDALEHKDITPDPKKVASSRLKQDNILKLLQQTPQLHGLNRTAWRLTDMSKVYAAVYGTALGPHAIGAHLGKMGYHFRKSRERLVSPDKFFREKMDRIKNILSNLGDDEKFFSIDEYGPAVVNLKTGWSLTRDGEVNVVPQLQKKRGWYILTAALELSANQVTHFYSVKKNTSEMIRLIDVLCREYRASSTLYISWDCASWHSSKVLNTYLKKINEPVFRSGRASPMVVLAPLPSSAQYLNVIESVFSGMAKAVIHNSDYPDMAACMAAIDRYFCERNRHFLDHPHRAGNKIWGKELVPPVFDETNNCKTKPKKKVR